MSLICTLEHKGLKSGYTLCKIHLSTDMLEVVKTVAKDRELSNIKTVQGVAESLPFADNSFDLVISRFSAHHWQDVPIALREMRRVCQPKGRIIIVDIMAPAVPLCDTFLQTIELLRDNSHVRDYSAQQWQSMVSQAGLAIDSIQTHKLPLQFVSWISRMRTPVHYVQAIKSLQQQVGKEVKEYFQIQADGSFTTDVLTLIAQA
ncbi:class I SAM-dependent methyltransferase [Psychrobacter lutiphocae]|uniref:class I SAM-dependent methyltransferase n=1 Tax=Psychrobacter lutiphocae TaxID=540500 RepID=UPI001D0FC0C7|nr:methyltransferase domain-containing protein [Psychrobacter lutiphocae]